MEAKQCHQCKLLFPLDQFNRNKSRKDGRQSRCKKCDSESGKKYYRLDREKYKARAVAQRVAYREWFRDYKKTLVCTKCGDSRWYVLDFHHRDDNKESTVSDLIINLAPKEKVIAEVSKCDCLCSNCHREVHYLEREASVAQVDRASG